MFFCLKLCCFVFRLAAGAFFFAEEYDDFFNLYSSKVKSLTPGLNVFLLHLGYDNEELRAVTVDHPEYGSLWRQLDFDVFNSDEFKKVLKDNDIKLVTWREIRDVVYD